MFPESTSNFEIKGLDIITPPEFIKFPRAILRRGDIISVRIEHSYNGAGIYYVIVNTKQKPNEDFYVSHYDSEDEAIAALDEAWQNLNPPLAYSATIDAPDDVVRELKGETKTEKEAESATFDYLTAVKELLEGKKVRVCSWPKQEYLYYDPDTKGIYDEEGFDYRVMSSWVDDVWEEYKDEVV